MAGNQLGKTLAGGMEAAMHATGIYPERWTGRRFDKPTVAWVGSPTGESTRENPQRILVGRLRDGTGTIPKDCIVDMVTARGIADLLDTVRVKHVSGGISSIGFKSYVQGREKWQGETLDWLWFDEEPPLDIYTEGLTRTNISNGPVWMTFTPMLGMSETVKRFVIDKVPGTHVTNMTIEEAEHYTPERRSEIIASYPAHEVDARTKGVPVLGSGRIFPIVEEVITCGAIEVPRHWPIIGAMDFGWTHPYAAVELAWDRDTDTVYVTKAHRVREATPFQHAEVLKPWGRIPWAWPRDGRRETIEGAGKPLADQFSKLGLDMLFEHAQFEDGSVSVEAGLMLMLDRMRTGRFKVFRHLLDWFEEFRLYHRKDGLVVKEGDDLMAATRYWIMMLRSARMRQAFANFSRKLDYQTIGVA
jgi:phage terminase large subunit-like protein